MDEDRQATLAAAERLLRRVHAGEPVRLEDLSGLCARPAEVDRAALRGHLATVPMAASAVVALVGDPLALTQIAGERRALADALLAAVEADAPLSGPLRHAFGVLSVHHDAALRAAVRSGDFCGETARTTAFDGPALRRRLGGMLEVPLVFDTTLGHAGQQAGVPAGAVRIEEAVALATPRGDLRLWVSGATELWRATAIASLEPETIAWLERTVDDRSVVYDVGANVGVLSLYAWRLGAAQVVAFEPEPLNFARLVENIQLNQASTTLALPLALSDRPGVTSFAYRDFVRGAASPYGITAERAPVEAPRVACLCQRLDALRGEPLLRPPSHLKLDVDGHEPAVLAGAEQTLADPRLTHLLIELRIRDAAVVLPQLAALGFRHTGGRGHGPGVANFIFERW